MHPKIKHMIQVMAEKEEATLGRLKSTKRKQKKIAVQWRLYILRCSDGSFYTGVTNNLERRVKMHNNGKAARYTRVRRPVEVIYQETCGTRTRALVRECAVKALSRREKEKLVI